LGSCPGTSRMVGHAFRSGRALETRPEMIDPKLLKPRSLERVCNGAYAGANAHESKGGPFLFQMSLFNF
jgi:hypothetical protein